MTQMSSPTVCTGLNRGNSSPAAFLVLSWNPAPCPGLPFSHCHHTTFLLEEDSHQSRAEASTISDLLLKGLVWIKAHVWETASLKDPYLAREKCQTLLVQRWDNGAFQNHHGWPGRLLYERQGQNNNLGTFHFLREDQPLWACLRYTIILSCQSISNTVFYF